MADLHTQDVTFTVDGGSCSGYLARPGDDQPRAGIIVVQEWWGLVDHIKDIARRFAAEGYVVLAPDLYHGVSTTDAGEAMKLLQGLDQAAAVRDVLGGIEHLKSLNTGKIGIVGYCMGGAITLRTAIASRDVSAAAPYYGPNPATH